MATVDEIKIVVRAEVDEAIAKMAKLDAVNKSNSKTGVDLAKSIAGYTTGYGLAVQAGQAVVRVTSELVTNSIKLAAAQERVKMEFSVLTGSMETGNKLFVQMNTLAAQTPLEMADITAAGKQLLSVGVPIGEITTKLRMLGDVAMGNPEKLDRLTQAFGQLRSKGVASMEQLNRFIEAGVPIMAELEKQTGKTGDEVFKMVSQGKIGYNEVTRALESMTGEGGLMHDMMKKVAETTEGKFSTAMDNARMQLADIGNTLLPFVNSQLDAFNNKMSNMATAKIIVDVAMGKSDLDSSKAAVDALKEEIKKYDAAIAEGKNAYSARMATDQKLSREVLASLLSGAKTQLEFAQETARMAGSSSTGSEASSAAAAALKKANALKEETEALKIATEDRLRYLAVGHQSRDTTDEIYAATEALLAYTRVGHQSRDVTDENYEAMKRWATMTESFGGHAGKAADDVVKLADAVDYLAEAQKSIKGIETGWNAAQGALGAYADLQKNQGDAEIARMKASGATNEEIAKRKKELQKNEFENNKAMKMASIVIDTASAVAESLPNAVLATIVGIAGAAQLGMVAAQQYVPMAEGGIGTVTKPTLFLAGEAGAEDFAFGPKSKGGLGGRNITIIQNIGGSIWAERELRNIAVGAVAMANRGY